jgi:hypothetical protein
MMSTEYRDANAWPDDVFAFAWFPQLDDHLADLAEISSEDWPCHHGENGHCNLALFNYLKVTYRRLRQEGKIATSHDGEFACFNTGLATRNHESLYALFELNRNPGPRPWYFKGWFRRGAWELTKFAELPELAQYFDDPACLVLDPRKEIRINLEHILADTPRERFPEPYRSMSDYALQTVLQGAIDNAKERVRRSYKAAIPQFYRDGVQLLLPLCLADSERADLALVVERHGGFYRAATCLTLETARNNARQLARPDGDWLKP